MQKPRCRISFSFPSVIALITLLAFVRLAGSRPAVPSFSDLLLQTSRIQEEISKAKFLGEAEEVIRLNVRLDELKQQLDQQVQEAQERARSANIAMVERERARGQQSEREHEARNRVHEKGNRNFAETKEKSKLLPLYFLFGFVALGFIFGLVRVCISTACFSTPTPAAAPRVGAASSRGQSRPRSTLSPWRMSEIPGGANNRSATRTAPGTSLPTNGTDTSTHWSPPPPSAPRFDPATDAPPSYEDVVKNSQIDV